MPDDDPLDPEIRAERRWADACRASLARMREEVRTMRAAGVGEGDSFVDKYANHRLREFRTKLIEELSDPVGVPLFFGRLGYPTGEIYEGDTAGPPTRTPDADRVYVGRRGVRDEHDEPMVVDWRAALARAFYEASPADPMGAVARRRYGFDHAGRLTAYEDEPLTGPRGAAGTDLLAAEIERPRTGPMRDIVATIQPEQMRLVRAPLNRTLCVQGAPGTGKTAVGLHRLAYLLYTERDRLRKRGGVAVVGPNRAFLAYIGDVLPALGEVSVAQTTIDELTGAGRTVERTDDPAAARIKGDARMADVIRAHLWSRLNRPQETLEVRYQHRTWRLSADEVARELNTVHGRDLDYGAGQELLATRLAQLVLRRMEREGDPGTSATPRQLRTNGGIRRAVRQLWPTVNAARLVFDLLTNGSHLAAAADGILSTDEQAAILLSPRPRSVAATRWSSLDLALLDEAAALLERPAKLAHVVVDEAQDLSPTQLRAIARRLAGSATVLGDLAQATSPAAVRNWRTVLAHLDHQDGDVEELTKGYRVPAEVIDFAARLLPHIAPDLRGPVSYRRSADALTVTATAPAELTATVVDACRAALDRDGSVGVVAADDDVPPLCRALTEAGVAHEILGDGPASARLTVAPVSLAKGLEFDTVLVVEPATIASAEQRGLHRLYVALTRAVSHLHVVHAAPLPAPLADSMLV